MQRKTSSLPTKIYTYGLLPPIKNADLVEEQLRLAKIYKNRLVEIELARRNKDREIMNALPTVAPLVAEVKRREEAVEEIRKTIKKTNSKARKRVSASPENENTISSHRKTIKDLRASIKEAKLLEKEKVKPLRDAVQQEAYSAIKEAYGSTKLFWGTKLLVDKAMEQARESKTDPRFRRWDGGGRIGVQLQNGRLATELVRDTNIQIGFIDQHIYDLKRGDRKKASRTTVSIRLGSDDKKKPIFAVFPMIMHRPLPEDAVVKWAWIKRTRIGLRYRYELQLVVESVTFVSPPAKHGHVIAIDVGWRVRGPNLLRIGYTLDDRGNHGEICLPPTIVSRLKYCEDLRSIQDKKFDSIKTMLVDWMSKNEASLPTWLTDETKTMSAWKSSRRLSQVAWRWKTERFDGDAQIFDAVDAWRIKWRHLYQWECDQRENVLARRKDFYRNKAIEIVSRCSEVVIEEFDLRDVAEKPEPEEKDTSFPAARSNRQVVAVSEFRQAILAACVSRGITVTARDPAYTTLKCHPCGRIYIWDPKKDIMHICEGCNRQWDQDHNACLNLLSDFVSGIVPPPPPTSSDTVMNDVTKPLDRNQSIDFPRDLNNSSGLSDSLAY